MPVTRIKHHAAMRLGLLQSVAEAYLVQLRRGSGRPEHMLRAEGIETLECVRRGAERGDLRIFQPDVIIEWKDWEWMRVFLFNGWTIPGVPVGASAPASKWHLRVNLRATRQYTSMCSWILRGGGLQSRTRLR